MAARLGRADSLGDGEAASRRLDQERDDIRDNEGPADEVRLERAEVSRPVEMTRNTAEEDVVAGQEGAGGQDDEKVHCDVDALGVELVAEDDAEDESDGFAVRADDQAEEVVGSETVVF